MIRLRNHDVQLEPIDQWPSKRTAAPHRSKFKAPLTQTQQLLDRELSQLKAKNVVLQMCITRADMRLDGTLRTGGKIRQPGVIPRFDSKHGPVMMPCDHFSEWEDNVRAIALALEALRAVDRYGVTSRAEQYRGWQALPAPMCPGDELKTRDDALKFLRRLVSAFNSGDVTEAEALRKAQFLTHPDRGGNADDFKRVMKCESLLKG